MGDKLITRAAIDEALASHLDWLKDQLIGVNFGFKTRNWDLRGADLSGANLTRVQFSFTDLSGANLTGANLTNANLSRVNLTRANLTEATLKSVVHYSSNFRQTNFTKAYLEDTQLDFAEFDGADFTEAILCCVNFDGTHLKGAKFDKTVLRNVGFAEADLSEIDFTSSKIWGLVLREANLTNTKLPEFQIPQTGSLIGYKKVQGFSTKGIAKYILKLEILPEAKRTATPIGKKCRAESAKVIGWREMGEKEFHTEPKDFYSLRYSSSEYNMGEIVTPDSYNPDIRLECTNGIHFFINETDAQNWNY